MFPADYHSRRDTLIAYLRVKCDQADWHGVSDAANDLRVLEAEWSAGPMHTTGWASDKPTIEPGDIFTIEGLDCLRGSPQSPSAP
jgi:hypothetical protein